VIPLTLRCPGGYPRELAAREVEAAAPGHKM